MELENKVIGILFVNNIIIKDNLIHELLSLKNIEKAKLIPIIKFDMQNIKFMSKITKFNPIFYNKGIILEKTIKSLDILILVACSEDLIYRLSNKIYNNNILNIIRTCKINNKPIIIGINFKDFNFSQFNLLDKLYNQKGYYFIPFKINNPITRPNDLSFDSSLLTQTTLLALQNIQIKPIFSSF